MSKFITVCQDKNCNAQNDATSETCVKCRALIALLPKIEVTDFKVCKTCCVNNFYINNKEPKVCWNCGDDELFKCAKQTFLNENAVENLNENTEKSKLVLQSIADNFLIEITKKGAVLGRLGTVACDYFENFNYVSRNHAEIFFRDDFWYVKDCGSTDGTKINSIKLEKDEEKSLKNNDRISLANVHFAVKL